MDDSPLAQHFLGRPQALWDDWDIIVAGLERKARLDKKTVGMHRS